MKLISTLFVLFAALLTNCQDQVQSSEIIKIEFGTSFGMCAGYCTQILTISDGEVSKIVTPRSDKNLKERVCSDSFSDFGALTSKVDISKFLALDETIGCPDCADGGAEWIEITTPEGSKKVTYEFQKEPEAVRSFIDDLRELYDHLAECE
ncbi:hypothetical protein [Ekhidna sp.]|uniref:hypothetical protein n=1 Tax=Ekhidna sp. TaxID=2608089 RepID=UPI003B5A298A